MADEPLAVPTPDPDTESSERLEEDTPTEDHETAASETQASEVATVEVLSEEIEELRAKAVERDIFLDQLQRTKADFINYQKRLQRDRERWADTTKQDFALKILPALDDLERARDAAKATRDTEAIAKGCQMIQAKLLSALADQGITPFDALGKPYDPGLHEAIARIERPDLPDQTVVEVTRRGYLIADRILRPAQVVVARGAKAPEGPPQSP
jgi:molecular chaperone GrpE